MKSTIRIIFFIVFILSVDRIQAQNWQLVWADEFNNGISGDWVFETGRGGNGWGNNELQYYRQENVSVQNGQLVLTAKRENFGGAAYTSVRMKTQGKKSWKYGKIEARIAMPSFQGVWPAFWMLGDNISSVGWPSCGEIDIMEHVNTGGEVVGTIHWADGGGAHAEYGGRTSTNITAYHTYAVEWNSTSIKWFVDGNKYHEVNIANGVNSTNELHNNFFILLNLAIGGNWPGFAVDNNAFPANMYVDYVRVYQDNGVPPTPPGVTNLSGSYQLQNRYTGQFLDVNAASTADGARIQQWTSTGCTCQNFKFIHLGNGIYEILADHSGKSLDVSGISSADGAAIVQWPYWGGANQKFKVVSTGDGFYKLIAQNSNKIVEVGGWSTTPGAIVQQWTDNGQQTGQWRLIPVVPSFSTTIQAESYSAMAGVQVENTTDAGGGQNVGYIDNGDWMAYNNINIPSSGSYRVEYRVASMSGGRLSLDLNAGSIQLGALNVPATGGWQNWTTISHTVNINAGTYNLGVYSQTGGWNINWIRITRVSGARVGFTEDDVETNYTAGALSEVFELSPNPVLNEINIQTSFDVEGGQISIVDGMGHSVYSSDQTSSTVNVSGLSQGIYTLFYTKDGKKYSKRFIKN